MKIGVIGTLGLPVTYGGVERHVEQLYSRLAARGHDITVYCRTHYTDRKTDDYQGIKLVRFPSIRTKHLETISHTFISSLNSLFSDLDIIHYHSLGPSLFSFIPALKGQKSVVTIHGLDWQREKWGRFASCYLKLSELFALYFPKATIGVSKNIQTYFMDKYRQHINYIPNGVNIPNKIPADKIKQWGLETDGYILYVGRLVPEKGCHYLIDAYSRLNTDLKLVIAGDSRFTDKYADSLKRSASKDIIFLGNVTGVKLAELFSNAYLFVQPSELEGLSIALLEAMSYGRCVLTSDIAEELEVTADAGLSFQNKDSADLR